MTKNSLKFTAATSGKIVIRAAYDSEAQMLQVCVSDNGTGVKESEQSTIFKKFGKLMRTSDMNSEGIGLGLTISKSLVEFNGGELRVASLGIDQGAHFMFAMNMHE